MPSGVVFLAIVVIWAVILLPRFARYYDRTSTQRSTRRFRRAMQTLGGVKRVRPVDVTHLRRPARQSASTGTSTGELIIFDPAVDLHLDLGTDPFAGSPEEVDLVAARLREERRIASSIAASRRRRVLYGLLSVAAASAVAVVAGVLPAWTLAFPAAAVLGFLVLSSTLARASRLKSRREAARAARHREAALEAVVQLAPVIPVRRYLQDAPATANTAAVAGSSVSAADSGPSGTVRVVDFGGGATRGRRVTSRPGSLSHARVLEQDEAIAATYSDAEALLGLDDYALPPRSHDGIAYLRVVNE